MRSHIRAFTLIELLIVVAIIAILAAIAVPNFLEAQTRAKVSRCAADMRSVRTALESYRVDTNKYPETDFGIANLDLPGCGMLRLTTPVAFITSVPKSPFTEKNMGNPGTPKLSNLMGVYLYVRALRAESAPGVYIGTAGVPPEFDANYNEDRIRYISQNSSLASNIAQRSLGFWELKSVGPNNVDDFNTIGANCRRYDPTNGTISLGDVVVFSDVSDTK
jgi:type II secretion system protein G